MIDIEALDRKPTAAILSIGACMFEPFKDLITSNAFYVCLDLQDVVSRGGTIGVPTLLWWLKQDQEIRDETFGGKTPLRKGLRNLKEWFKTFQPERVWARGTTYDISILTHGYSCIGENPPWKYNEVRDSRICDDMFLSHIKFQEELFAQRSNRKLAHSALADAIHQAKEVKLYLQHLERVSAQTKRDRVAPYFLWNETM